MGTMAQAMARATNPQVSGGFLALNFDAKRLNLKLSMKLFVFGIDTIYLRIP